MFKDITKIRFYYTADKCVKHINYKIIDFAPQ